MLAVETNTVELLWTESPLFRKKEPQLKFKEAKLNRRSQQDAVAALQLLKNSNNEAQIIEVRL